MRKFEAAFDPAITVTEPVTVKGVSIARVQLPANHSFDHFFGEHVIGVSPEYPTITPAASESDAIKDVQWRPGSIGLLPRGVNLNAAFPEEVVATYIALPDYLFKNAAFETVDINKLDHRWMPDMVDPVANDLIGAMMKLSKTVDIHDWPILAESIGTALAVRMLQQMGAQPRRSEPHPGGLPRETLNRVLEYVEANLSRQIRLPELAGVALLSSFHFARAFKQAMRVAPIRYVWGRRVERAKEALRDKARPLVVIAYDCGYSSQAHFATAFKEAVGVTPRAFRLALRALVPPWLALAAAESAELMAALA